MVCIWTVVFLSCWGPGGCTGTDDVQWSLLFLKYGIWRCCNYSLKYFCWLNASLNQDIDNAAMSEVGVILQLIATKMWAQTYLKNLSLLFEAVFAVTNLYCAALYLDFETHQSKQMSCSGLNIYIIGFLFGVITRLLLNDIFTLCNQLWSNKHVCGSWQSLLDIIQIIGSFKLYTFFDKKFNIRAPTGIRSFNVT